MVVLRRYPRQRFPADKRNRHVDFGPSKFRRWSNELERFRHFTGRRVDLLMRALPVPPDADPVVGLREYLAERGARRSWRPKGVVLIEPESLLGTIVWPAEA